MKPRDEVLAEVFNHLATIRDMDALIRLSTSDVGRNRALRDKAKNEMFRAVCDNLLFDWQPMATMPRGLGGYTTMVIFENTKTGSRYMDEAWADDDGTLFYTYVGDDAVPPDLRAVAWSYMPDSKALGGK